MIDPRTPFDSVPEAFDRWRPRYCDELFNCVAASAALGPGRRSLEIGPGTGQATEFALKTGADCTAIELGANLASVCERKFSRYPNFHLIRGDFATYPFEPASFDLVYSAATIQWIGEDIAYPRCRDILRPGGTLAMFLLRSDYKTPNPALYADIQKVYDEFFHSDLPYTRRFNYENAGAWGFGGMERRVFPVRRIYTADEYVEYIGTHSDHICLKPEFRKPFYDGIHAAIERHGGHLEMAGEFVLYLWKKLSFIPLREKPEILVPAAEWFHEKWHVPPEAYLKCMRAYLDQKTEYGWYLCLDGERIVGGLGVIENDFHDRKDLTPNVCAVYTEEDYRCRGIAGHLLKLAVEDLRGRGVSPLYLLTDHTGFYEHYGWEFFCMAQGDGEEKKSRMYVHW